MTTLREFLQHGRLDRIQLGISPFDAESILGEPQYRSRKNNPLELKYGSLRLTFWKHSGSHSSQLMSFGLYFRPAFEPIPSVVMPTDFHPTEATTKQEFRDFMRSTECWPVHMSDGLDQDVLSFLSGVVVTFAEGKLNNIRATQRLLRETTPSPLSDVREPTIPRIKEMILEARSVTIQFPKAGLLLAWAVLEAVMRRVAIRAGRKGQIGVQSSILIRELVSSKLIDFSEAGVIEDARQLRTAISHGIAHAPFDQTIVWRVFELIERLLPLATDDVPAMIGQDDGQ